MRVFLFLSKNGSSIPLAERVYKEGHRSVVCTDVPCGDGIVEKVAHGEDILEKIRPDCVYVDAYGIGKIAENIKSDGTLVIGSSRLSDLLLADSSYVKTIIKVSGVHYQTDGLPLTLVGWFNGESFVCRLLFFEETKLLDDDMGPTWLSRGCVGTYDIPRNSPLHSIFDKLEPYLVKSGYRGAISISVMASSESFGVEHISPTMSNPCMFAFADCSKERVSDVLYGIASGVLKNVRFKEKWMSALSMIVLPLRDSYMDVAIKGVSKENEKHLWFVDAIRSNGVYRSAGVHGDIVYVSARGIDSRESRRRMYRTTETVSIDGCVYRTDIGRRVLSTLRMLTSWKYL